MKILTFSFDDCEIYDRKLTEMLRQRGMAATFFLISGSLGERVPFKRYGKDTVVERVSPNELKDTYRKMEIASHTRFHRVDLNNLQETVARSAEELSALSGQQVRGFAYPGGHYTHEMSDAICALGFAYARTVAVTHGFDLPKNWSEMHPTCHIHDPALTELIEHFRRCDSGLFHIYGHSYEFTQPDPDRNWDALAQTLDTLAGWDGVQYLTNLQVYERLTERKV